MAAQEAAPTAGRATALLAGIALADLALHLALSGRYGYWIDELYFLACGDHLAWGYVDHPPLIAAIAALERGLFGDSLFAIRLLPALSGAVLVFLTGWMAGAPGGGRTAQVTAAVATAIAPVYAAFAGLLTMIAFEPLFWMGCAYLVVLIVTRQRPELWLAVGGLVGVGLLNKLSMAFFVLALIAGLVVSPQRRMLLDKWAALGGLVAVLVVWPHLRWQAAHGWPTLELLANARRYQFQPVTPLQFVWGQVQIMQPATLPLWLAGLGFLLVDRRAAPVRCLGSAFVVAFVAFMAMQAKTYYLAPIYPMLFAAGGVVVEDWARSRRWVAAAALGWLGLGGAITAPYALPILPVTALPTYLRLLGIKEVRPETRAMGEVPQLFADMLGWDELVAAVVRVHDGLPAAERQRAAIWGLSYGAAGAVDFLGARHGLPKAISGHQNYYLWGPGDASGDVMIAVGFAGTDLTPWFERVELAAEVECPYCMPDRQVQRVYLCRGLKLPLAEFWPQVKCWTCARAPFQGAPPADR
jgi:hypothetical protein